MHLGDGLDWTGTFQDVDLWPDDSLIRDVRFRFASARAIAGTRLPLDDDLDWEQSVADDVEYLVTHPVSVIDWPAVTGWDDGERRFSLRHHAGLLRILQGLLHRGLWGGIMRVPSSTLDAWERELSTRRRECYDALLALRLNGRLSWQKDLTTWDALFRSWSKLLKTKGSWRAPLPSEVLQVLVGHATEVAAIASDTGWYVSRNGSFASQSFKPRGFDFLAKVEVYALGSRGIDAEDTQSSENTLRIGLVARAEGDAELRLSWKGLDLPRDAPSGDSSQTAPDQLRRAINACRG